MTDPDSQELAASSPQALNKAMREAVDFVHAEGWETPPTLFALVPSELLIDQIGDPDDATPLTLVVQDNLPENLAAGGEALVDYVSRVAWPEQVTGAILAQEIVFRDSSASPDEPPRPARLFSGALRPEGVELTLLQLRPSPEELEDAGPFAEDEVNLRGGPDVAPGIIAAIRHGLDQDPDQLA